MYDIVTIGSVTRDNFLESEYKIIKWPKTQSGKAICLPFGEKLQVDRVFLTTGGNSANASVTLARQGFKTACFGKVGDDLSGRELIQRLKEEGIYTAFAVSKEQPTAYSSILLSKGERTILGYHGASDTWALKDIPWNILKSKWWYLSLAGESDKFLKPLLNFAKNNKVQVAFNPSGHHLKHKQKEILSSLKSLSFLVLNEGEAANLAGIPFRKEKEVFRKLDKLTPGIVAVTDGPNGVTVSDGKYLYKAGVFKEKSIVDRTGAGDAFGSGFVAGLMRKNLRPILAGQATYDLRSVIEYAIRLASANATSVVERIGATEGVLIKSNFEKNRRWRNFEIKINKL